MRIDRWWTMALRKLTNQYSALTSYYGHVCWNFLLKKMPLIWKMVNAWAGGQLQEIPVSHIATAKLCI